MRCRVLRQFCSSGELRELFSAQESTSFLNSAKSGGDALPARNTAKMKRIKIPLLSGIRSCTEWAHAVRRSRKLDYEHGIEEYAVQRGFCLS